MIDLATFNALPVAEAQALFLRCCGATRWVEQMAAQHPFASEGEMLAVASATWRGLARTDWLEAFAAHPRIGDLETLRSKYAGTIGEQAGVACAAGKDTSGSRRGKPRVRGEVRPHLYRLRQRQDR